MYARFTLIVVLVPLLTAPAHAGIIFGRKAKPDPAVRVPELIQTVRTDGDENKRVNAIEELRQYDPASFPEIMPALIDALLNDRKAAVRAEAASAIAKLRPVSQAAGDALEQALDKDSSVRVRLQVRSALLQYHWAGYRQGGKKEDPPPQVTTKEPPLADPKPVNPPAEPTPTPPRPLPPIQPVPTPPPPVQPAPTPPPPSVSPVPSPLPQGPPVEAPTPSPTKPPQADSGPDLGAPPE